MYGPISESTIIEIKYEIVIYFTLNIGLKLTSMFVETCCVL